MKIKINSAQKRRLGRQLLPAALAILLFAGCDCEQMLASKRGSEPVYRVEGAGDSDSARTTRSAATAPPRQNVEKHAAKPAISDKSAGTQSASTNAVPAADVAQNPAHQTRATEDAAASAPGRRPPVWSKSAAGAASPAAAEPAANERGQENDRAESHQWGTSNTSLSRLGRIAETRLPPLGTRMVIKGIDGRSDLVEAAMPDKPSMEHVPENP